MDFFHHIYRDYCKGDNGVWIVYMLLTYISIIGVFSASSALTFETGEYLIPIRNHSITVLLGLCMVLGVQHIPVRIFRLIPWVVLPVAVVLLVAVMVKGMVSESRVNDAARWIFGFQPSELGKMGLVGAVAYIMSKYRTVDGCSDRALKPILIISAVVLGLIAPENGSTACLLAAVVYLMMFIGGIPTRQMVKFTCRGGLLVGLGLTALITVPPSAYKEIPGTHRFVTWRNRILEFADPMEIPASAYYTDKTAQRAHANIAIASSHIIGKGPGNSAQRDFISHGYSDFIYAIIIEETGLLGGLFIIYLYIVLMIRVGRIAKKCKYPYQALLVTGLTLLLVGQAMMHMMVSVGLFPVTGQPLPLVSKGGTAILAYCCYIGIILSVSRSVERKESIEKENITENIGLPQGVSKEEAG